MYRIAESPHCTTENNITLYVSYTGIKIIFLTTEEIDKLILIP